MRVADMSTENMTYRPQTHDCEAPGCLGKTREGKAYCSEHVEMNTYASKVIEAIARRDAEDALVVRANSRPKDYNVDGVTARSILQQLEESGTRTKKRLCLELHLEPGVLDAYTTALVKKGLVRLGRTNRGGETLTLPKTAAPRLASGGQACPDTRSNRRPPAASSQG